MQNTDKKVLSKSVLVLLSVVVLFVVIVLISGKNGTPISNYASTITGQAIVNINGSNLVAAVADTPLERERGLAGTHTLNDKSGVYFVFDDSDTHAFWMKGMTIPIDIIWMDENNQIVYIEENVQPNTYPKTYQPPVPAKYVLEVAAGYVQRNNVSVGDLVVVTDVK